MGLCMNCAEGRAIIGTATTAEFVAGIRPSEVVRFCSVKCMNEFNAEMPEAQELVEREGEPPLCRNCSKGYVPDGIGRCPSCGARA